MAKVAIMGHGVVGSGVAEVLRENSDSIFGRAKEPLELTRILDLREFPNLPYAALFTQSFADIENDPEISVVAETMGGLHPAFEYTQALLKKGKSVVTSNKELVAQKGDELLILAREHNVNFLFEASVGGGIPIIRPLHQCLASNRIEWMEGILNGTTNFILTRMFSDRMSFDEALELAQKFGYAEQDPSADIDGVDANRKICILASLAYGTHIYPNEVHCSGIRDVRLADMDYAQSIGGVIKMIARAELLSDGKVSMMVCPAIVPKSGKLAWVDEVDNAVLVKGNAVGEVLFVGQGAGKRPTASAVVADMMQAAKAEHTSISQTWEPSSGQTVSDYHDDTGRFYFRVQAKSAEQARQFISNRYVSPTFLLRDDKDEEELAFCTGEMTEREVQALSEQLADHQIVQRCKLRLLHMGAHS